MASERTDIVVQIWCDYQELDVGFDKYKKLVRQICRRFDVHKATVSIAIVDDDVIKKVNAEFLNTTARTDVLSFDLSDDTDESRTFEVVINGAEAVRQGRKRGHSAEAELALYITHGLLHNLGFDDTDPGRAEKMQNAENEILQQAGFDII